MPPNPLKIAVAEFNIDDLTSNQIAKINKNIDRTIKNFVQAEREVKKTDTVLRRFGRGLDRIGQRTTGARRFAGGATRRLGGGDVSGALGSLPFGLGAGAAAAIASTQSTRQQFLGGIQLQREIKGLGSDFRIAFGDAASEINKELRRGGLFKKEDIQAAFTTLTDLGITAETAGSDPALLRQFAQAQGAGSIDEALQNLLSGNIRAGRGVSNVQISQIRQLTQLLGDPQSAEVGFQQILSILRQSGDEIDKFAERFRRDIGKTQADLITTQEETQKTALEGVEGGIEAFRATEKLTRIQNELTRTLSQTLSPAIQRAEKLFNELSPGIGNAVDSIKNRFTPAIDGASRFINKVFGFGRRAQRQTGGNVTSGQTVTVGESGIETFTPRTGGKITNNNALKNGSGRMVMNNNITINTTTATIGAEIERTIKDSLNKFSRTTFRMNTGLALSG